MKRLFASQDQQSYVSSRPTTIRCIPIVRKYQLNWSSGGSSGITTLANKFEGSAASCAFARGVL